MATQTKRLQVPWLSILTLQPEAGGMSSAQECTAAKQQQRGAGIPVIVTASSGGSGDTASAVLRAGIDGVSAPLGSLSDLATAAGTDSADSPESSVRSILGELELASPSASCNLCTLPATPLARFVPCLMHAVPACAGVLGEGASPSAAPSGGGSGVQPRSDGAALNALGQVRLVDDAKASLVDQERQLLTDALALLDEVCPQVSRTDVPELA